MLQLIIQILSDVKQAITGVNQVKMSLIELQKWQSKFGGLGMTVWNNIQKSIKKTVIESKLARKEFDFTFLTYLFAGMALQRVSGSILRGIFNVYQKVAEYNTPLTQSIMGVQAAFEYLKWSIFNALSQSPLFMKFLDWVIDWEDFLSDLIGKYPTLGVLTVAISAIAFVLGTGFYFAGFIKQIWMAIQAAIAGTGGASKFLGIAGKASVAIGIAGLVIIGLELIKAFLENPSKAWDTLKANWRNIISSFAFIIGGTLPFPGNIIVIGVGLLIQLFPQIETWNKVTSLSWWIKQFLFRDKDEVTKAYEEAVSLPQSIGKGMEKVVEPLKSCATQFNKVNETLYSDTGTVIGLQTIDEATADLAKTTIPYVNEALDNSVQYWDNDTIAINNDTEALRKNREEREKISGRGGGFTTTASGGKLFGSHAEAVAYARNETSVTKQ